MFDTIMGLPAHVLLVHAAVVFLPLLALAAVVFAMVPSVRSRIDWAVALLCLAGPTSALAAKLSGAELEKDLVAKGYGQEILAQVHIHRQYGDMALWFSLGLAAATFLFLLLTRRARRGRPRGFRAFVMLVLNIGVVVLAAVTAYYVYRTGDSGATAVWAGVA